MSRARYRKLIKFIVVFGVLGMAYWCVMGFTLPIYRYESSDRGFAEIEVPWKGRHLDSVRFYFAEYLASKGDPSVTLCRTSRRNWSDPHLWWDNLTNPRWDLPYIPPSSEPNYNYSTSTPNRQPETVIPPNRGTGDSPVKQ